MASIPVEKQFSRLGISSDVNIPSQTSYEMSPDSLRKFGPSVAPKPQYKAQPQVPIVPKSSSVSSCLEPSFSTLLKTHNDDGSPVTSFSSSSNYENVETYHHQGEEPIYGNIHQLGSSILTYLPPPPPPPAFASSCDNDVDLPLPPPPQPADLSGYYSGNDHLHLFPTPPSAEEVTSPPSPVSSSYSELRRAGCGSTIGSTSNYAPLSQVLYLFQSHAIMIILCYSFLTDNALTGEIFLTYLPWPHAFALNSGGQTHLTNPDNELPSRSIECFRLFSPTDLGLYGAMVVYLPS